MTLLEGKLLKSKMDSISKYDKSPFHFHDPITIPTQQILSYFVKDLIEINENGPMNKGILHKMMT